MTENPCFRYFEPAERLGAKDQGSLMRRRGCNGSRHVDHLFVEHRDEDGTFLFGVDEGFLELDPCDGTCGDVSKTRGPGFPYDPKMAPYSLPC